MKHKDKQTRDFKMAPSYYDLLVTGTLLLINIVIIVKNYKKLMTEKPYHIILLISFIGILAGIHGILHLGLEKLYNYNPIQIIKRKFFNNEKRKPLHQPQ